MSNFAKSSLVDLRCSLNWIFCGKLKIIRYFLLRHSTLQSNKILPLSEISSEWLVVIDGVEEKYYGKDSQIRIITYKLADRSDALRNLYNYIMKHKEIVENTELPTEARKRLKLIFERKLGPEGKEIVPFKKPKYR